MAKDDVEKRIEFGDRLKKLMHKRGVDIFTLSVRIDVPEGTISSWRIGKCYPQMYNLEKLCDALNVSADYLLFGKEK